MGCQMGHEMLFQTVLDLTQMYCQLLASLVMHC